MATKKLGLKTEKIVCDKCGKSKPISQYYASDREEYLEYGGYIPTCKSCCGTSVVDDNLRKVTPEKLKPILKKIDVPYIESVFIEVANNQKTTNGNFLGNYKSLLNLKPKYKNLKYADTIDIEIEQEKIKNSKIIQEKIIEITDEMKRFWGRNQSDQDYTDLQEMFDSLTEHEIDMDYKKESDYKALCIYELQKSKIQFDIAMVKQVETLQKMIDTLSSSLGIKAIQKKDTFDNNKFVLGLITRYHEDIKKKPIRRWVEDLGNVDLFRNIVEVDYTGNLAMAMGIEHPRMEEYKKELEKYSVDMNEIMEDYGKDYDEDGDVDG